MTKLASIAAAYDAVAAHYDRSLARDLPIRRILWRHFARLFRPGDRVIDVGCGTGLDTVFLASRGVQVTAIDASPGMIAELNARVGSADLARLVDARLGDINEVMSGLAGQFAGIVSSFAALNTVDLGGFATAAARLVRPGGRIVSHVLSPGRDARDRGWTVDIGGRDVFHLCLSADEMYRRFFREGFSLRRAYGLGFLLRDGIVDRWPRLVTDLLGAIESVTGTYALLRSSGRFQVLDLERRGC